ncbi:MAG: Hsp33 family molecular chaperone HslO [Lentisphaerae bacterium]|nr:Hsp33 family molecular chaperone HslO [Lentisphaerota bacterium]
MIMPKSSDLLTTGFSPGAKVRLVYAEVTDSSRALEQNHLSGPTAGLALAEALTAVALLGADLNAPDETIVLRMQLSGPLQGLLVEMAADGALRGYTNVKVLDAFDGRDDHVSEDAFGERGDVQIIRSVPGRMISQAAFMISPASPLAAVEGYLARSLQRPSVVQIASLEYGGSVDLARGILVERLPDGDPREFARITALVADGTALEALECGSSAKDWCETVGLADIRLDPPRPLAFRCRCSLERVESLLGALTAGEIAELVRAAHPTQIYCHMCGKGYEVPVSRIEAILKDKPSKSGG